MFFPASLCQYHPSFVGFSVVHALFDAVRLMAGRSIGTGLMGFRSGLFIFNMPRSVAEDKAVNIIRTHPVVKSVVK